MGTKKAKYLKKLYVGPIAATQRREIDRAVRRGTYIPGLYLITYAANGYDQLDIMHARYLLIKRVRKELPLIVGIAIGRDEAFGLIERIAGDCYRATGAMDFRAYLGES